MLSHHLGFAHVPVQHTLFDDEVHHRGLLALQENLPVKPGLDGFLGRGRAERRVEVRIQPGDVRRCLEEAGDHLVLVREQGH
ncbi:hypothetical protein SFR_1733 [Streptomyces sp. FR-008]|nr:hypothetical protein SFR_1733 [Streptomyces sp. FR-008]